MSADELLRHYLRGGRVLRKHGPEADGGGGGEGQDPKPGSGQESGKPGDKKEGGQEPRTFDEEYVKALRKENADYRTKLKEIEDANLTAAQKLQKERDEALTELQSLREERRLGAIQAVAKREGAKYEDLVAMKVPADTKPEDYVAAVKAVRKDYPELFNSIDGDGGKKGDSPKEDTSPGMGTLRAAYATNAKEK